MKNLKSNIIAAWHKDHAYNLSTDLEDNKAGFGEETTKSLMLKYGATDWNDAYSQAYDFHSDRYPESFTDGDNAEVFRCGKYALLYGNLHGDLGSEPTFKMNRLELFLRLLWACFTKH